MEKLVNRTSGETSSGDGATDSNRGNISKRRQTKMLLVSLIESFCRIHGDSPEANRRVFFLICQTLSSLGFIDAEFVDEMASVRSTFQGAFQKLFYTAVQTVRTQAFRSLEDGSTTMMRTGSSTPRMIDYYREEEEEVFGYQSTHTSIASSSTSTGFSLMNVQNSRYRNDFVQVALLGRGGFASVWRARNKLDGIDYAIKRIRLGDDLVDDGYGMPYDKIFREIKHLARLEHHNVVRYYGSWLEYNEDASFETSTPPSSHTKHVSDDEDSIFNGCDPTFEDDMHNDNDNDNITSQDMSHIHFGNDDDDDDDDESTIHCHQQALCIPHTKAKRRASRRSSTKSSGSRHQRQRRRSSSSTSGWMLYIQMYLCPGIDLIYNIFTWSY